jgi:hypothetical protein
MKAGMPSRSPKRAKAGDRGGIRTHDLLIKSQLLYRLSYAIVR